MAYIELDRTKVWVIPAGKEPQLTEVLAKGNTE